MKARVSPVMLLLAVAALGVAGARLVSMFEPDGSDPVSPLAFAATPATPAALSGAGRGPEGEQADDVQAWPAAFGRQDMAASEPEPGPVAATEPEPQPAAEPTAPPQEPEPEESMEYWLTGLIRGGGEGIALVHDGMEEQVAAVGSQLSGGETVIEIGSESILARRDNSTFRIVFREDPGDTGATPQRRTPSGEPDAVSDVPEDRVRSREPDVAAAAPKQQPRTRDRGAASTALTGRGSLQYNGGRVAGDPVDRNEQSRLSPTSRNEQDLTYDVAEESHRDGDVSER